MFVCVDVQHVCTYTPVKGRAQTWSTKLLIDLLIDLGLWNCRLRIFGQFLHASAGKMGRVWVVILQQKTIGTKAYKKQIAGHASQGFEAPGYRWKNSRMCWLYGTKPVSWHTARYDSLLHSYQIQSWNVLLSLHFWKYSWATFHCRSGNLQDTYKFIYCKYICTYIFNSISIYIYILYICINVCMKYIYIDIIQNIKLVWNTYIYIIIEHQLNSWDSHLLHAPWIAKSSFTRNFVLARGNMLYLTGLTCIRM